MSSKDEVITTAEQLGCPFTEPEFNSLIWGLEVYLTEKFDVVMAGGVQGP